MAKLTLSDVGNLIDATSAKNTINSNNAAIVAAVNGLLSLNGYAPNTMNANLDMNSFQILNLPIASSAGQAVPYQQLQAAVMGELGLGTTGIVVATSATALTTTTITGTSGQITVTNGSGVLGNPTLSFPTSMSMSGITIDGVTLTNASIVDATTEVLDATFKIQNSVDQTKQLKFTLSGITTGTTVTLTPPTISDTLVGIASTQTLTNKTLTAPVISTIVNTGTLTLPTSTDTLVGRATTDTLTNKTLTSPTMTTPTLGVATATSINKVTITAPATSAVLTIPNGVTLTGPATSGTVMTLGNSETVTGVKTFGSTGAVGRFVLAGTTSGSTILDATAVASGTITLPAGTDTLVARATTDTLTNKTISGSSNTLSNIANASLSTAAAYTFKGNVTASSATPTDFTITGLTQKTVPASTDLLLLSDTASSSATKKVTAGSLSLSTNDSGFVQLRYVNGAWVCFAPDGSIVSTAGTTTSGWQECINYAQTNGYNWEVVGLNINSAGSAPATLVCTTAVTIGPCSWKTMRVSGAVIQFLAAAYNCITLDTMNSCSLTIDGLIQRSGGTSSHTTLAIYPHTAAPYASNKSFQMNYIQIGDISHIGSVTTTNYGLVTFLMDTTFQIVENTFRFGNLDCGSGNYAEAPIRVNDPPVSSAMNDNQTYWNLCVGGKTSSAIIVGNSTTPSGVLADNRWGGSIESTYATCTTHVDSYETGGSWFITSADVNSGAVATGLNFRSNTFGNIVYCPHVVATLLWADAGDKSNRWISRGCSFAANKSADQTGVVSATPTQIVFGTETYDAGSNFASNAWTPLAGMVTISAGALVTGTITAGSSAYLYLYKNGSAYRAAVIGAKTNEVGGAGTWTDYANGTDVYTVYIQATTSAGTATVVNAVGTYFTGIKN